MTSDNFESLAWRYAAKAGLPHPSTPWSRRRGRLLGWLGKVGLPVVDRPPYDQFMLRFPEGMRWRLHQLAALNGRSMNTEIIAAVEERLKRGDRLKQIEMRLANLEYYVKPTQHLEPRNHEP